MRAWRAARRSTPTAAGRARAGSTRRMVGRDGELALLRDALRRARVATGACQLFTVLGAAGVGKSRLVRRVPATALGARPTVLVGRCLPYGEGITYWPLARGRRAALVERRRPTLRRRSWRHARGELVERLVDRRDRPARPTRGAARGDVLGGAAPVRGGWRASGRWWSSFEDIHWAEPTLLDLIEHLADWVRDAPILLLCLARPGAARRAPDLGRRQAERDDAPARAAGRRRGAGADRAPPRRLPVGRRRRRTGGRMLEVAGGNPLFLEQLVAAAAETGGCPTACPAQRQRADRRAPRPARTRRSAAPWSWRR